MVSVRIVFRIAFFASALWSSSAAIAACPASVSPCTSSSSCQQRLTVSGGTAQVHRSHDLTKQNCDIRHAIVALHGRDLNPGDYFGYITSATRMQGRSKDTLIVSPYFREPSSSKIASDLYWDRKRGSSALYDWAMGGDSVAPAKVSSFTVIDEILKQLVSGNFPTLKSIVVTGHSAGGQLVQRYAVGGNPSQAQMAQQVFYVSANPSSYAYLDKRRPLTGSTTSFAVPVGTSCKYYDEWGYGLDDLNVYLRRFSYSTLVDRYTRRRVTYLVGDRDTSTSGIDTTCYANLQGKNRFVRGIAFANYIREYYAAAPHKRVMVSGVGHDPSEMFESAAGRAALFPLP